jgi:hypothetical protein
MAGFAHEGGLHNISSWERHDNTAQPSKEDINMILGFEGHATYSRLRNLTAALCPLIATT